MNGEQCRSGMRWLWHIWIFCRCTRFGKLKKTKNIWQNSRSVKRYRNFLPQNGNIQSFHNTKLFGGTNVHVEISFEKLRKARISFVFSVCLSVCLFVRPHGTNQFPLHGFLRNLISQYYSKICTVNLTFITTWQHWRTLYMKVYVNCDNISLNSS